MCLSLLAGDHSYSPWFPSARTRGWFAFVLSCLIVCHTDTFTPAMRQMICDWWNRYVSGNNEIMHRRLSEIDSTHSLRYQSNSQPSTHQWNGATVKANRIRNATGMWAIQIDFMTAHYFVLGQLEMFISIFSAFGSLACHLRWQLYRI